jgi:hypothetical protein
MTARRTATLLRRVVVATLVALACLVELGAARAEAFTVSRFKASDQGARIHYYVTVCGARGYRVLFHSYLHTDMGIGSTYTGDWSVVQRNYCSRWDLSERDRYREGQWDAQLRVVVRGIGKYTPLRYLEIT